MEYDIDSLKQKTQDLILVSVLLEREGRAVLDKYGVDALHAMSYGGLSTLDDILRHLYDDLLALFLSKWNFMRDHNDCAAILNRY